MLRKPQFLITIIGVILLMALMPLSAFAGSKTTGDITLTFPDDMVACSPTFKFITSGVGDDWPVVYNVFQVVDGSLTQIGSGSTTGNLDVTFTPAPLEPGDSEIYAVFVDANSTKLSGKWKVVCEEKEPPPPPPPPPTGDQGCTPGYWRQDHHYDSWEGFSPTDSFNDVFGVDSSFGTLGEAVWARGGQENALTRHAVAAILNDSNSDVAYAYTFDQIIEGVQEAFDSGVFNPFKDQLDEANNAGCPLN